MARRSSGLRARTPSRFRGPRPPPPPDLALDSSVGEDSRSREARKDAAPRVGILVCIDLPVGRGHGPRGGTHHARVQLALVKGPLDENPELRFLRMKGTSRFSSSLDARFLKDYQRMNG